MVVLFAIKTSFEIFVYQISSCFTAVLIFTVHEVAKQESLILMFVFPKFLGYQPIASTLPKSKIKQNLLKLMTVIYSNYDVHWNKF